MALTFHKRARVTRQYCTVAQVNTAKLTPFPLLMRVLHQAGKSRHVGSATPFPCPLQRAEQVGEVATRVLHSRGRGLRGLPLPQGQLAAEAKRDAISAAALKATGQLLDAVADVYSLL